MAIGPHFDISSIQMANVGLTVILTERSRAAKTLVFILWDPLKDRFTIFQVSQKTNSWGGLYEHRNSFYLAVIVHTDY